jgi:hypothetical protein
VLHAGDLGLLRVIALLCCTPLLWQRVTDVRHVKLILNTTKWQRVLLQTLRSSWADAVTPRLSSRASRVLTCRLLGQYAMICFPVLNLHYLCLHPFVSIPFFHSSSATAAFVVSGL